MNSHCKINANSFWYLIFILCANSWTQTCRTSLLNSTDSTSFIDVPSISVYSFFLLLVQWREQILPSSLCLCVPHFSVPTTLSTFLLIFVGTEKMLSESVTWPDRCITELPACMFVRLPDRTLLHSFSFFQVEWNLRDKKDFVSKCKLAWKLQSFLSTNLTTSTRRTTYITHHTSKFVRRI